jgi:hypothetical protein
MAGTNDKHKISYEDFRRYEDGEMTLSEQHVLEKQMLDDQSFADAFEGFRLMREDRLDYKASLSSLNENLINLVDRRKKRLIPLWAYAAAASIFIAVGLSFYYLDQKTVSLNEVSGVTPSPEVKNETLGLKKPLNNVRSAQEDAAPKRLVSSSPAPKHFAPGKKDKAGPVILKQELLAANESVKTESQAGQTQDIPTIVPAAPAVSQPLRERAPYTLDAAQGTSAAKAAFSRRKDVAYTNVVSGRVVDQNGQALPGVMIFSGQKTGVATDQDGRFSISVPFQDSLRFGYVGFKNKWVAVNQPNLGSISLEEDAQALNEVLVTGKAAVKKQSFTGNFVKTGGVKPINGWEKYQKYIRKKASKFSFADSVRVTFNVNADGSLSEFKTDLSGETAEAAVKIIKEGPAWKGNNGVAETVSVTVKFGE